MYTPATTSLALLALLGSGNTTRVGPYREPVKKGLKYLLSIQGRDGCVGSPVGDGRCVYEPAVGAFALAEALGLSCEETLRAPAERAIRYVLAAQRPDGGWRWGERAGSDTLATAWAVLALRSGELSGIEVPAETYTRARGWLDSVTDPATGRVGYLAKGDGPSALPIAAGFRRSEVTTAAALAARVFLRVPHDHPVVTAGVARLLAAPPAWDPKGGNDFLYCYFGNLATFQIGGDPWKKWTAAIKTALVPKQIRGGCADGTFDPCDAWGEAGGRIYATAINIMTLEIYYRYGKILPRR